jgi:hypothetical protein
VIPPGDALIQVVDDATPGFGVKGIQNSCRKLLEGADDSVKGAWLDVNFDAGIATRNRVSILT